MPRLYTASTPFYFARCLSSPATVDRRPSKMGLARSTARVRFCEWLTCERDRAILRAIAICVFTETLPMSVGTQDNLICSSHFGRRGLTLNYAHRSTWQRTILTRTAY